MQPRFYTWPESPTTLGYPYILSNYYEWKRLKRWNGLKHGILDVGIEVVGNRGDYPDGFLDRYYSIAFRLTQLLGDRIWCVIPDFCDDMNPGLIKDNVEKTLSNIDKMKNLESVNWVYPLQARYLDLGSFKFSCSEVSKLNPKRVAIGTVCKTRNKPFIIKCCMMAREYFPESWIHAFGPTLDVIPNILPFIDSWDSSSFFFNVGSRGKFKSYGFKKERRILFQKYLAKVNRILENHNNQTKMEKYNVLNS